MVLMVLMMKTMMTLKVRAKSVEKFFEFLEFTFSPVCYPGVQFKPEKRLSMKCSEVIFESFAGKVTKITKV